MTEAESEAREPTRLSSAAAGASPALRAALEAGRAEVPTEAQLGALAARLAPLIAPVATGLTLGVWPVAASLIALAALGAAIGSVALRARVPVVHAPIVHVSPASALPDGAVPEASRSTLDASSAPFDFAVDPGAAVVVRREREPRARTAVDAGTTLAPVAPEVDVEAELRLLRAAQDALRADPVRALSIVGEHVRRFGDGTLAQEREVVAIEALVALSRLPEARARAERFSVRWPRSAHARRLAVILGDAEP